MSTITIETILSGYSDKLDIQKSKEIFQGVFDRYKHKGISLGNITLVLIALISEASKFDKLTGSDKKDLVTEVLEYLVLELPCEDAEELRPILRSMIPVLINNIVDMSKGNIKIDLHKTSKQLLCCLKK